MAAAKRITQATFDDVVQENMVDFDMPVDEAIKEAASQFLSQGVSLVGIVTEPTEWAVLHGQAVAHPVTDAVNSLAAAVDSQNTAEIASSCRTLRPLLDAAELDNRKLAATAGAFPLLLRAADATSTAADARAAALLALAALLRGQPDLVTPPQPNEIIPDGTANANVQHLVRLLRESVNSLKQQSRGESKTEVEAACGALRAVRHACTLHEANRQGSVTAGVVPLFVEALSAGAVPASGESASSSSSSSSASPTPDDQQVVREAARALRVLTYDDDIRVAFGKGHEHARLVVGEHGALPALVAALRGHLADGETVTELCNTLARLAVRNEFCQEIVDLGGLTLVLDAMHAHAEHLSVLAASLGLLRAIAGNDDVKARIRAAGGLADIVAALTQHVTDAHVAEEACAALAAVCLRNNDNCRETVAQGAAHSIIKAMHIHAGSGRVQTQACRAIRNIVARNRDLCPAFLDEGAERYINTAMSRFPTCADDAKAALRDLECKVELRELWTGLPGQEPKTQG